MTDRTSVVHGAVCACCLVAACPEACRADLVFSNFGPELGTIYAPQGVYMTGYQPATEYEMAMRFVPMVSFRLDAIRVPVFTPNEFAYYAPKPPPGTVFGDSMQVSVYADGGGQPGALLEMADAPDSVPFWDGRNGPMPTPVTTNFSGTVELQAGMPYWVGLTETEATALVWMFANYMEPTLRMNRYAGNPEWHPTNMTRSGLQVYGTPVPAPAGLAALAGLLLAGRGRSKYCG